MLRRGLRPTFIDPSFPRSPYRVRYRVAGELPYEDASTGRLQLAACSSWLR